MGTKGVGSIFILFLNLLLVSTVVVASHAPLRPPQPPPSCLSTPPIVDTPSTPPPVVTPLTPPPSTPPASTPPPVVDPSTPPPSTPPSPSPPIITPSTPPASTPPPTTPSSTPPSIPTTPPSTPPPPIPVTPPQNCNLLNFNICVNVLNVVLLNPRNNPCCTLVSGLVDLDASMCLCAALKANVLRIRLNINADLGIILNRCGVDRPAGFRCIR